jgi:V-type H+-transporting ATPase subunit C
MSKPTKHLLVSLPTSINPSNDHDEALTALRATVSAENGTVIPFQIPSFKIGTLDALVQQADELAKLEKACEAVVGKVGESLRSILDGDEDKLVDQKRVQGSKKIMFLQGINPMC